VDPQYLLLFPLAAVFMLVRATRHTLLNIQYFFLFTSCFIFLMLPWTVRNHIVYKQPIPVALEATRYLRPFYGEAGDEEAVSERIKQIISRHSWAERFKRNTVEFWRITSFGSEDRAEDTAVSPAKIQTHWSLRHNVGSIITFGLLLPFFALGIIASILQKNYPGWLLTLTVIYYFLMRMTFGGSLQARLPVEPLITLLAFYGFFYIISKFRKVPT
jgi:hypothetical protein